MLRTPVESSYIKSVGYDPATEVLEIEFTRGVVYQYMGVPRGIFQRMMGARSHGRYFYRRIRGRFAYQRITAPPDGGERAATEEPDEELEADLEREAAREERTAEAGAGYGDQGAEREEANEPEVNTDDEGAADIEG